MKHGFLFPIFIEAPDVFIVDGYDNYDPKEGNVYRHTKITFDGKILYDEISRWVSSEDPDGFSGTEYPDETKKVSKEKR